MSKKREKGQYGYRDYHRKVQLAKVIFGAAMILIQAGARGFTDNQAAKNILTVMAVLSVLPTANVASPLLASWKYRTLKREFYERVRPFETKGTILYDLILTSKEQIMAMDVIMVHPTGVFALCRDKKTDEKKAEKYLNNTWKAHGLDPDVKVMKDEKAFFKKLENLRPAGEPEDDNGVEYAAGLLKNLSM